MNTGSSTHHRSPSLRLRAVHGVAFAPYASSSSTNPKSLSTLPLQKLAYLGCNILTLALGLWKCRSMGLLPTGTADWLAFETRGPVRSLELLRVFAI